ncbi:MAG: DHH family phosphoesterase [Flavobacteriales bacterium]|nr:DHH family phosphoesterase [Flavobacteriales bacterium]
MSEHSAPPEQLQKLRELLAKPKRLAIVSHYNPDGDAIGSSLGLMHVLRAAGHTARVVLPNTPANFLDFLPGRSEVLCLDRSPDAALSTIRTSDLVFCLDFNQLDRIGGLEEAVRSVATKVLIDHHQQPDTFAEVFFSDISASSTCQMVADIVAGLGMDDLIGLEAATCLYTGMITDSGSFRYKTSTPHTLRVAARLLEEGVDLDTIYSAISDTHSADRMRLLGFALTERMTVLPELRTVVIGLNMDDLEQFNVKPGDTEGFVNYGLSIQGMRLAALFIERPDMVKVSLRSKGNLPVDRFLKEHFSGGGHANAAGGKATEPFQDAVARFMSLLPKLIADHPA